MIDPGARNWEKMGVRGRDARRDARRAMETEKDFVRSNREPNEGNPYRRILDRQGNYNPTRPSEIKRQERLIQNADDWDRQNVEQHLAEIAQLEREASPDYQQAKEIYVRHVNDLPAETPTALAAYAAALNHLDKGDYPAMFKALHKGSAERLAEKTEAAKASQMAESEAVLENCRTQAELARAEAASLSRPPEGEDTL